MASEARVVELLVLDLESVGYAFPYLSTSSCWLGNGQTGKDVPVITCTFCNLYCKTLYSYKITNIYFIF